MAKRKSMKLQEAKLYSFTIEKVLILPGDQEYFVLVDPSGEKHLLKKELYKYYGLAPGTKVHCRVDKIDCNGKIYLEPEHPYYREGNRYDFRIIREETRFNAVGDEEKVLIVQDIYGQELIAPGNKSLQKDRGQGKVECRIERIKKGRLHLSIVKRGRKAELLKVGLHYMFKVSNLTRGMDNHFYFILIDPFQQKHLLRQDYFSDYGISVGSSISGTAVKYSSDGKLIIEPDHPHYRTGNIYRFDLVTTVKEKRPDNEYNSYFVVKDMEGKEWKARVENGYIQKQTSGKIDCRIERIKKGRLILQVAGNV